MRRVTAVVVLCGVLAVVVWLWAAQPFGDGLEAESPAPASAGRVPERPADAFPMIVRHVYDGDTIRAQMRTPNDIVTTSSPVRIRLIGIDTPEGTPTRECWADEARSGLAAMLPEGSTVWAAADHDTWDHYDRRLLYLWTDDGRFVNHELVARGDAESLRVAPNVAHAELLSGAEDAARAAGAGRWGACG